MAELPDVRFLTVAEVAELMRVSKMTVYRLVHSGELGDGEEAHVRQLRHVSPFPRVLSTL